jgi:hypothetical protein
MDWIAVRCCCQPTKVFGFMRLDRDDRPGTVRVVDVQGTRHQVELKRYSDGNGLLNDEIAVYSDDQPLEFWRRIVGFVEAHAPVRPVGRVSSVFDYDPARLTHRPVCASNNAPPFTVVRPPCDCGAEPNAGSAP